MTISLALFGQKRLPHPYRIRGWLPIISVITTITFAFLTVPMWVIVVAVIVTIGVGILYIRPFAELVSMPLLRRYFRIESVGPGVAAFPRTGPVIVIANHASLFDPPIVVHELPREVTGVMTSAFSDRWYFYALSRWVFRVIRVPDVPRKTETPEVDDIIAAIDRGRCIMIFPEGWLRRKEEIPLRRFGQGIWRVLQARPDTLIVPCWLEGTWGSRFSHKDGPPGGKKPRDRGRQIRLAIGEPRTISPEILTDPMTTRFHLMDCVTDARKHLGLPPLPSFSRPESPDLV